MYVTSEGIVLRQTKIAGGRRMLTILTKEYGKVSCGTSLNEGGKNKTALALRSFTHARYQLVKNADYYNITGAETLHSYFAIGENVDKYMHACFVLELTDKVLFEGTKDESTVNAFRLLTSFLETLQEREKSFSTLSIAYEIKLLKIMGSACSSGFLQAGPPLINNVSDVIMEVVNYIENHRLSDLQSLALSKDVEQKLKPMLKQYLLDNLGIGKLNSEELLV